MAKKVSEQEAEINQIFDKIERAVREFYAKFLLRLYEIESKKHNG
jgi:hypothetical protein